MELGKIVTGACACRFLQVPGRSPHRCRSPRPKLLHWSENATGIATAPAARPGRSVTRAGARARANPPGQINEPLICHSWVTLFELRVGIVRSILASGSRIESYGRLIVDQWATSLEPFAVRQASSDLRVRVA